MVLVEELAEDEVVAPALAEESKVKEPSLKKGFLEKGIEPLYPEGSPEGKVAPETHKAHQEHHMNEKLNADMNRGAKDNFGFERPEWYTKEWPKDCQYNAPGCALSEMDTSGHATQYYKEMVTGNQRWKENLEPGVKAIRLSFTQATDEDLQEVIAVLKGNQDVTELDLSHNHIKDAGIQALVATLAAGAAPNLRELRIYSNEFGDLGKTMLTQGLPVFRKKLDVRWQEPSWAQFTKPDVDQAPK